MKQQVTSPHLSIYKWQITNTLSILHRLTGVAMFFAIGFLLITTCYSFYFGAISNSFMVVLKLLAVFVTIVCLCYHLANGIRFLYIDFTRQISLRSITVTGIMALLAALLFFVAIVALMILPL